MACGDTTTSSIDEAGGWDAYKLTLTSPNWIKIYTTGTTDTYGHLYDGSCNEIAQDDTVDGNFYISQTVRSLAARATVSVPRGRGPVTALEVQGRVREMPDHFLAATGASSNGQSRAGGAGRTRSR